jgi:hypothetical protein
MKRALSVLAVAAAAATLAGCYRVTVVSGAPTTATKIDLPWQKSWVYGIVPPDTIRAKERCPNGVAEVMVETSFLNGLVGGITWGIFTPIHPVVTCSSSPRPGS